MRAWAIAALLFAALAAVATATAQTPVHKPGGFHSPEMGPGTSWDLRLNQTGEYPYHCHPHATFMQGKIGLSDDAPSATRFTIEMKDYKFQPGLVTVRPFTTITFTNRDDVVHTVDESIPPSPTPKANGSPSLDGFFVLACLSGLAILKRRQ